MSQAKELIFEEEARVKLQEGVDQLADIVGVTLGPLGRNVGLQASFGSPKITNDGGSVARDIVLRDQFVNMGLSLGKEVVKKVREEVGDGTTTSVILLRELVRSGVKCIASGASPVLIKRGMEKATKNLLAQLEKRAKKIRSDKDIKSIATASASGNELVGKTISEAFAKVGPAGVVSIDAGKGTETFVEMSEGMAFDRGYLSSYFCTDTENMHVKLNDALIFLTDKKISSIHEILPLLQSVASTGKELLIIAEDIEGDALSTLVVNKLRGTLRVTAVKAPGFGDRRKEMLEDIAILVGATVVSGEKGMDLKKADMSVLGQASALTITKDKTTIVGGKGTKKGLQNRIAELKKIQENTKSEYDREKLEERRAKLQGGVAIIRVGAASEVEMQHLKGVFEDALNATKAAIEEGIVIGGGVALVRAAREVTLDMQGDEKIGAESVLRACTAPLKQLVKNSGCDPSLFVERLLEKGPQYGFDAKTCAITNLETLGIFDPTKVVKSVLANAAELAGLILLSEALIGDSEDSTKE